MNRCGECQLWFREDFSDSCPQMRAQQNDLDNKVVALKKKSKTVGSTIYTVGIGIFTEACSKFVEVGT